MKRKILNYIKEYACREGVLPTYREICEGIGLKSTSSVAYYMNKLVIDREIDPVEGLSRYRVRGIRYESNDKQC